MKLSDVKIGDKVFHLDENNQSNRMYLRIDLDLKSMLTRDHQDLSNIVPVLDLTTYKICGLNGDYEVEVEYDNVSI